MTPSSAATVERASQEPIVEDVFLTPRVLDETAFREFSSELRTLIVKAGAAAKETDAAAAKIKTVGPPAARVAKQLEEAERTLERAGALVEESKALRARADELRTLADAVETNAKSAIARAEEALGAMVEGAVKDATDRARQIRDRLDESLNARAQDVRSMKVAIDVIFDEAEQRLVGLREQLDAAVERSEEAKERLAQEIEQQAHAKSTQITAQVKMLDDAIERAGALAEAAAPELLEQLAAQTTRAESALAKAGALDVESAAERLELLMREFDRRADDATQIATDHEALLDRARALLTELEPWKPLLTAEAGDDPLPAKLREVVDQARVELTRPLTDLVGAIEALKGPGAGEKSGSLTRSRSRRRP